MPNESVAAALGRFSNILGEEVQRQDIEEQKERRNISTQRITDAFQKLGPNHDEEDVRRLMMESISDASALETLDTSMPLITGLYNQQINAVKEYRATEQERLLREYARDEGYHGPAGLEGEQQLDILKYEQSREYSIESYDPEKGTILTTFDAHDRQLRQNVLDARTDETSFQFELRKIRFSEEIKQKYRNRADNITYAGTTAEGLPISFNKAENMFYIPYTDPKTGNVTMRPLGSDTKVFRGTSSSINEALKSQKLFKEKNKAMFLEGNTQAQNVFNKLGIRIPTDTQGEATTSAFGHFKSLTDQQVNDALLKAGYLLEGDDGTYVNPAMRDEYNQINFEIQTARDLEKQHNYTVQKANESTNVVDYEEALGTYNLSPEEFNTYYDQGRQILIFNPDLGSSNLTEEEKTANIAYRDEIRLIVKENLGLKESDVNNADDTKWVQWFDQLNDKVKARIMDSIRREQQ